MTASTSKGLLVLGYKFSKGKAGAESRGGEDGRQTGFAVEVQMMLTWDKEEAADCAEVHAEQANNLRTKYDEMRGQVRDKPSEIFWLSNDLPRTRAHAGGVES